MKSLPSCIGLTALCLAAACSELEPPSSTMTLRGDVSAIYDSGRFVIFEPVKSRDGKAGAVSMMPASKPPGTDTEAYGKKDRMPGELAEAKVVGGQFELTINVTEPSVAYFHVLDGLSKDGTRFAPIKGSSFILEPGTLSLTVAPGEYVVTGEELNDTIYNSWKLSPEYRAKYARYRKMIASVDGETPDEAQDRRDAASQVYTGLLDLETEGRKHLALTHEDPLVRKLALQSTWLVGNWVHEASEKLATLLPEDPWVQEHVQRWRERAANVSVADRISKDGTIPEFAAETLSGETVRLSDIRGESEIVLVEFWASWCGPCRVEIPHMKEAYETYRGAGFEIVSFTIDESREAWDQASEEEQIPWHNLGMGPDADAPTAYGVTGVPKNYLVDSATGEILAEDLRGRHLDRQLGERFDVEN